MAVFLLITFLFTALIFRLFYIEVIDSSRLQAMALDQWTRDVKLQGDRGVIYDRNGIVLADTESTYTVYARPNSVKDKPSTAAVLSRVLGVDYETLLGKMNTKVSELTVSKLVKKTEMQAIKESGVTGVYFSQNVKRVYPYGDFLSQILGFTNIDGMGQAGLEAYYNDYLKGVNGYILTETDLVGRELDSNTTYYVPGTAGNSLYLTIDQRIQSFAEQAVRSAYLQYNAKATSCLIMNAKTGAILAMAEAPSFDLNNPPRDNVAELFQKSKSTLISNVYEPGSTFKILTAAIGLETGSISRNYNLYCPGYRIVDGQRIKCWRTIGHGSETFDKGVQNSCNCLFMDIAEKVGTNRFYDYLDRFGMTSKTGIDMSGEASGLTIKKENVKTVDLARMGFGQAIAVTAIELVAAAASVINGGVKVRPHILDRAEDLNGLITYQTYKDNGARVISEATSAAMREILEGVVAEGGGKNAQVAGYRIGGKTGTAQKYANGAIAQGKYVSTFLGFAPADDPEYIALFLVDEPQGSVYYGSMVAAPYMSEVFSKIFAYEGRKPSYSAEELPNFRLPDFTAMTVTDAIAELKRLGIYYELSGEGDRIKTQFPVAGAETNANGIVLIELGS